MEVSDVGNKVLGSSDPVPGGEEGGESPSITSFSLTLGGEGDVVAEGLSEEELFVAVTVCDGGGAGESSERCLIPSVRSVATSGERGLGAEMSASSSCAGKGVDEYS